MSAGEGGEKLNVSTATLGSCDADIGASSVPPRCRNVFVRIFHSSPCAEPYAYRTATATSVVVDMGASSVPPAPQSAGVNKGVNGEV